jgi:hypothetical protein
VIRLSFYRVISLRVWVISSVRMKSANIRWKNKGDSTTLSYHWRWFTKVWGAKQIRDLSSPHPEYWVIFSSFWLRDEILYYHSASVVRWQRWNGIELAGLDTNSGACGLIGWSTINLTLSLVLHGCCKRVGWSLTCVTKLTLVHHKYSRPDERGYTRATTEESIVKALLLQTSSLVLIIDCNSSVW